MPQQTFPSTGAILLLEAMKLERAPLLLSGLRFVRSSDSQNFLTLSCPLNFEHNVRL